MPEIETMNDCGVGVTQGMPIIMLPPRGPIPKDKALRLASYLVCFAEEEEGQFQRVLEAIQDV